MEMLTLGKKKKYPKLSALNTQSGRTRKKVRKKKFQLHIALLSFQCSLKTVNTF